MSCGRVHALAAELERMRNEKKSGSKIRDFASSETLKTVTHKVKQKRRENVHIHVNIEE